MSKKRFLIIFIIFFTFMFLFKINVKAEEYAYCYYNYTPDDSDFKIRQGGLCFANCEKPATVVLQIAYNSEKYKTPRFAGRLILASDANFSDGYDREFSNEIKYQPIRCSNIDSLCIAELPEINDKQLRGSDNKTLVCPSVYLFKNSSVTPPTYQIGLSPDSRNVNGVKYDSYETISPDSNYSKTKDDSSNNNQDNVALSCNYNYSGYYNFGEWFTTAGQLGFNILNDGTVDNIYATGLRGEEEFKYEGDKLNTNQCPNYINMKRVMGLTTGYISISVGTAESHNAVYNGDISNAEENKKPDNTVTRYQKYGEPNVNIYVENVGGNYNFNFKSNGVEDSILVTNFNDSEIKSKFENAKYPRFIMKLKSSSEYIFSDSIKDQNGNNYETSEVYININYLGPSGTGLSDGDDGITTCTLLFGDTLLQLLYDYVFKVIWIGVPIILILLTTFDFAKIVFSDEKDGMPNAFTRLWKRAIASILIFLTPYIIIWIANLVDPTQTTVQSCAKKIRQMGNTSYIVNNLTK